MNTAVKIAAFGTALAATFGAAWGAGKGVGPLDGDPGTKGGGHSAHAKAGESGAGAGPGGLALSAGGYSLDLRTPRVTADESAKLRFVIRDARGEPVTSYRTEHGKELHLIVASRDLGTYRHLHPERAPDGTWSTGAALPRAGDHRVFADFTPRAEGAQNLTLGADLAVAGDYAPRALPAAERTAEVDGYEVRLAGALEPGKARELELKVSKGGKPVTDLQPYLGAYGHLVALRAGDLGYLHVHPEGEPGDGRTKPGPGISFTTTAPSAGTYRLFLDFRHEGTVRTAAFTVHAGDGTPVDEVDEAEGAGGGHTDGAEGPEGDEASQGGAESGEHQH